MGKKTFQKAFEIEAVNELLGERENLEIREVVSSALKVLKA